MFVTYSDGQEVIITTEENEMDMVNLFFGVTGRDMEDFDREVSNDPAVLITSDVRIF